MAVALYWLGTYFFAAIITLTLSWSVFYPNYLHFKSELMLMGNSVESIWRLRTFFYFMFLPVHLTCYLAICWLYSKAYWFGGKLWVISITFLIADRLSVAFWIWYFNRQLPDMWMVWGMVSLLFCMTMSAMSKS